MNTELFKMDINRMIKYYTKELNATKSYNLSMIMWYQAKIEAYQDVSEMIEKYELI